MAKGFIEIDSAACKGCELCVTTCPKQVIVLDKSHINTKGYHSAALVDPDHKCTGCALCAVMCPDVCITVYQEPAAARRIPVVTAF